MNSDDMTRLASVADKVTMSIVFTHDMPTNCGHEMRYLPETDAPFKGAVRGKVFALHFSTGPCLISCCGRDNCPDTYYLEELAGDFARDAHEATAD